MKIPERKTRCFMRQRLRPGWGWESLRDRDWGLEIRECESAGEKNYGM